MFDRLLALAPVVFGEDSTFTAVVRWDYVDLDGRIRRRITPGLNFRPTQDTVFKVCYEFGFDHAGGHKVDDDAFVVGIATYF
jgi:hypothetical protein